jgi:LacI family transcriptional regulator
MNNNRIRPNLSEIAALLEVSAATVSNALSGKGRVSAELTEKIRATAADMGYIPGTAGRALRTGRSYVLGLVLPDIANPLFPQIAQAIEHAAAKAGYGVLIGDSRGNVATQTEVINRLLERGVDGAVIVPRHGTRIADIGCPLAVIDSPSTPGNTVSADHWQGGQLVAEHLVSMGHRKILIIGNNPASNVQNDRIGGMKSRMPAGVESETLWIERLESETYPGCPLGLAQKFNEGFTAFATLSDLHALRVLTELLGCGISVPDEASVTGFDDLIWLSAFKPSLTTVHADMPAIAKVAIDALASAIERNASGGAPANSSPVRPLAGSSECIPMSLVVRETSAPPRSSHA